MAESISRDDVQEIARLARLRLSDAEIDSLRVDLSAILEHMDALREVDTDGVEPMTHVVPATHALRADVLDVSLPVDTALSQAPRHGDGFFVVPNIIAGPNEEPTG